MLGCFPFRSRRTQEPPMSSAITARGYQPVYKDWDAIA